MKYQVIFYQSPRGKYPVQEFLESLDRSTQAKVIHLVRLLENYGPYLKPPYIKKIDTYLYELRTSGKIAVRIFYSKKNNVFVLLHGFIKKTQKAPSKEIKIALERLKELL
ncbi:MAG TPA: type II toxin-antitoxin system RelE/ParE family toxin [Patescibacteria group bacterium]